MIGFPALCAGQKLGQLNLYVKPENQRLKAAGDLAFWGLLSYCKSIA